MTKRRVENNFLRLLSGYYLKLANRQLRKSQKPPGNRRKTDLFLKNLQLSDRKFLVLMPIDFSDELTIGTFLIKINSI